MQEKLTQPFRSYLSFTYLTLKTNYPSTLKARDLTEFFALNQDTIIEYEAPKCKNMHFYYMNRLAIICDDDDFMEKNANIDADIKKKWMTGMSLPPTLNRYIFQFNLPKKDAISYFQQQRFNQLKPYLITCRTDQLDINESLFQKGIWRLGSLECIAAASDEDEDEDCMFNTGPSCTLF